MVSGNKREDLPFSNHTKGDSGVNLIAAAAEGHALTGKGPSINDLYTEGREVAQGKHLVREVA